MKHNKPEIIYPVSPRQEAMLPDRSRAIARREECRQMAFELRDKLDLQELRRAWRHATDTYSMLRTSFVWRRVRKPLQVAWEYVTEVMTVCDLSSLPAAEQERQIKAIFESDRKDFDPAVPPLARLTVIRQREDLHKLVWTCHRLALDEESLKFVSKQVFDFYNRRNESPATSAGEQSSFRDYVLWLKRQDATQAKLFWRQALKGATLRPITYPAENDVSSSSRDSDFGESLFLLSLDEVEDIRDLERKYQVSLATIVQGAWAILLSRYKGVPSVTLGNRVSGRPRELESSELILGPFSDVLPVFIEAEPGDRLSNWLMKLESKLAAVQSYQHHSLAQICEWGEVPEDFPLFESIFNLTGATEEMEEWGTAGCPALVRLQTVEQMEAPLSVDLSENINLSLRVRYDRRIFSDQAIARMLGHLSLLLKEMVLKAELEIRASAHLTQAERYQQLVCWNATESDYPNRATIGEQFEVQVSKSPQAAALVFEGQAISYLELNRRANQLAHYLRRFGVGPEVVVGVCFNRSVEMVVAILGVLKAGGCFLPLDPSFPLERLSFMMEDSQTTLALTQDELLERLPATWAQPICLDGDWEIIAENSGDNIITEAVPDNLAYIIYTSGSTGRPKGVQLTHRGVLNLAEAQSVAFQIGPGSRVLQFASLSFDASISEIFVTLLKGGELVIGRLEELQPGAELIEILKGARVTTATLPPAVMKVSEEGQLPDLKTIVSAGEACTPEIIKKWGRGRRFINAYGPTEVTVCATLTVCANSEKCPPIGRPIDNTKVYILDERMEPVAIDFVGEIYIAGVGLARGYHRQPCLTAEKFVPNPFNSSGGERLYRTGDLGRYRDNGEIEYVGRRDAQVKMRGYRVELAEIEAVIREHHSIEDSVLITRGEGPDKHLVAYLVESPEQRVDLNELKRFLQRKLPGYMTPAKYALIDKLPLTVSGKVDRARLPQLITEQAPADKERQAARTGVEKRMVGIWSELLEIEGIGINDNFFELGGHSLLATQLLSRIREVFEVEMPVRTVFKAPTIASLASEIEAIRARQKSQTPATIRAIPRADESFDQILARLNQLSESEVRAILQSKTLLAKGGDHNE